MKQLNDDVQAKLHEAFNYNFVDSGSGVIITFIILKLQR